jgi:HipA-like protein
VANIFVNRQPVGTLSREDPLNRFAYDAAVPPSLGVSLLMPVAAGPYVAERSGVLHPVFDMNLPEGALRTLGRHTVELGLHAEVSASVVVVVASASAPQA